MQPKALISNPRYNKARIREAVYAYVMILPGITLMTVFILAPIVFGFWISLHNYDGFTAMKWIAFNNYVHILTRDKFFLSSLMHTVIFAIGVVAGKNVVGLALAMLLYKPRKGITLFRTAMFMPVAMSGVVIGSYWSFFLSDTNGFINNFLNSINLGFLAVGWLSDSRYALMTVIIVEIWRWSGLHMMIFLAGIQGISPDMYESAYLDGASWWVRLTKITLPLLKPIIFISTLLALMGAFVRNFEIVWMLTRGGPGNATDVVLTRIYNEAFQFGNLGRASAMGYILFVIVGVLSFIYVKMSKNGTYDF